MSGPVRKAGRPLRTIGRAVLLAAVPAWVPLVLSAAPGSFHTEGVQIPDSGAVSPTLPAGPDSVAGRATRVDSIPAAPAVPPTRKTPPLAPVEARIERSVAAFRASWGERPAWGLQSGRPFDAIALLGALDDMGSHGLNPADYRVDELHARLNRALGAAPTSADSLAALDDALTRAFITCAVHLSGGRVDTSAAHIIWKMKQRDVRPDRVLARVLRHEVPLRDALDACAPPRREYAALRAALPHFRALAAAGNWPTVPDGDTMKPGGTADSARVVALEARLRAEGDVDSLAADGRFTDRLVEGVKRFQSRSGLEVDGAVGTLTLRALNRTPADRVRQIELNLERWRWMPEDLADHRVQVMVPAYRLDLVDGDRRLASMRVIVGKDEWETPSFSDSMRYVVLNPAWNVPKNIAQKEILAKAKADSSYLAKEGYEVFASYARDAEVLDPTTIDWASMRERDLTYRIRQRPGAGNPLGRMKFMFPNRFDVYLHDTSSPRLFNKGVRDLSHGCIRIEKPLDMAEFLFPNDPKWTRERFQKEATGDKEKIVYLRKPVAVYILYFTAWVNEAGEVEFYNDIYDVDREMQKRLDAVSHRGI